MKRYLLFLLLVFFAGCHQLPEKDAIKSFLPFGKKDVADTSSTNLTPLDRAKFLQEKKEYPDAIAQYKAVLETKIDAASREQAKIGLSQCLTAIAHYAAALKALEPLPLDVRCDTDAQKLAVAGEILLRQRRESEAVVYLEIAAGSIDLESVTASLSSSDNSDNDNDAAFPDWLPAAAANLASAYTKTDKPQSAVVMYEFAEKLYLRRRQYRQAEQCRQMYDDLYLVMKNYVPFQPAPVAYGLPAGRY
ncbi:MAG: tetratricopeptide repeat protein [Planctomycetaceae bacterium]|nr:tetratricopeptide repeat protein [Planctomycetaceae bacterium]